MEQKIRRDLYMGANLRRLRLACGLSQEKLCAELQRRGCDIGRTTYAKYESGELNIRASVIVELRKIYDCSYGEFFAGLDGEGDRMTPPGVTGRGLFLHSTSYAKGSSSLAGTLRGPAGGGDDDTAAGGVVAEQLAAVAAGGQQLAPSGPRTATMSVNSRSPAVIAAPRATCSAQAPWTE